MDNEPQVDNSNVSELIKAFKEELTVEEVRELYKKPNLGAALRCAVRNFDFQFNGFSK